jgi:response regulator RpfG family c-di-GMP phosphodiesterase
MRQLPPKPADGKPLIALLRQPMPSLEAHEDSVLRALYSMAHQRDSETASHTTRMAHYSAAIARGYGVCPRLCDLILLAAPLHDIGKVGIPDAILLKPGPLDEAEWAVMKQHPIIGHEILSAYQGAVFAMGAEISLAHHERWDGKGYPQGLAGSSIPLSGRIVAVADVFDALTTARPYKDAWSCSEAMDYIDRHGGSLFDPEIVQVLRGTFDVILGVKARFQGKACPSGASAAREHGVPAHASGATAWSFMMS